MAIVINGQTGIDAGHLPISNAGNTEIEGTLTGADVTVASITANSVITQGQNVSPFSGFKNYIINGNFDVWQYKDAGMTYPQTGGGYGSDDRWVNNSIGSTKTHSQVACTDTERALFNASFFSRTVVTSVAGATNHVVKFQSIENITKLAGKTVTLSFWAKADSAKNIAIEFGQNFGTGGTPASGITGISSQIVSLTSTWQKKTITVTIPSIVGKTLGTDGVHTTANWITFWLDAGSNFNSRAANLGQQSGTFDIAQVQLEEGSVATPFEQRPIGLELSLCQRYYEVLSGFGAGASNQVAGNSAISTIVFKVEKRAAPTMGAITVGTNINATSISFNGVKTGGCIFNANPIVNGTMYVYNCTSSASAEL